jgi:general secretion pathway protein E
MSQIKVETATIGWPGLQAWSIDELHAIEFDFERIGIAQATSRRLLAGRLGGQDCLVVSAAASPDAWDWLQASPSDALRVGVVPDSDFEAALARHGSSMKAMDSVRVEHSPGTSNEPPVEELSLAGLAAERNPVVRVIGSTLFDAFRSSASDIHVESNPTGARIQYRLDGVLVPGGRIDGREITEQAISRIKVMASERSAGSVKTPRTALVIVVAPGLRMPRMDMHRCSHSTTTITPSGARTRINESAT